jgi:hypothetical protein
MVLQVGLDIETSALNKKRRYQQIYNSMADGINICCKSFISFVPADIALLRISSYFQLQFFQ